MYDLDVDRLLNLAAGCQEAIRQRVDDLAHLREELQGLDGRTCSGREWRMAGPAYTGPSERGRQ